jgi:bla regulator protein BlaR1
VTGTPFNLANAFLRLLEASFHASLLALVVGFSVWILRDRISARWKHAAWMLVALRLCLPAVPSSPVSLLSLVPQAREQARQGTATVVTLSLPSRDSAFPPAPPAKKRGSTPGNPTSGNGPFRWSAWLAGAWLLGCVFSAGRLALALVRERGRSRNLVLVDDARLNEVLGECARELHLRALPPLLSGPGVAVPALAGIFKPSLLVPPGRLADCSRGELRQVFLHELAHLKRRDIPLNCLLAVLETVHWFNPLARWAFRHAREERELACDELVLQHVSESDAHAYASTLLRLIESSSLRTFPVAALGLRGERFLARRLRWIAGSGKRKCSSVLAGILLACCAVAGLTCAKKDPQLAVRVYEVEQLLEAAPDFAAPVLGIRKQEELNAPLIPEDPDASSQKKRRRFEELAARLRSEVSPEAWEGASRMDLEDDKLKVTAPEEVQEGVQEFLDRRLAENGLVVVLHFNLLVLDNGVERLPLGVVRDVRAMLEGEKLPSRRLSPGEVEEIEGATRVDSQPTLTTFNGQMSHILVGSQLTFTADVKRTVLEGKEVAEPVVNFLTTGFTVQGRADISRDRKRAALDLQYQWADAPKPFTSSVVEGIVLEMPELSIALVRASIDAPFGEWMLAGAFGGGVRKQETRLLLVKAELVSP